MLICTECGNIFDEEETTREKECVGEYWGAPAYKDQYYCPHCGSEEFEEARRCPICGEWTPDDTRAACQECWEDVYKRFTAIRPAIMEEFPEADPGAVLDLEGEVFEEYWNKTF